MEKVGKRQVWIAIVCFAMFAITAYFLLEAMDLFSGGYDKQMLPVIVYYTIQTNIFVAIWALYIALWTLAPKLKRMPSFLSMLTALYMSVTGVVYWLVLVPMLGFGSKLFSMSNIWMHAVTPIFAVVMFFVILRGSKISVKRLALVVIYPLLYLVSAYILRMATGAYVYPFFDPTAMRGGVGVALALVVIAALFIGLGAAYRHLWNKRMNKAVEYANKA